MSPFDIWKIIGEKVIEVTEVERISRDIAKSLGCNGDTDHEILHCMRERPLSEIMSLYSVIIYCIFFNAYAYFTACVYTLITCLIAERFLEYSYATDF